MERYEHEHEPRRKPHGPAPRWIAAALLGLGLLVAIPLAMQHEDRRDAWRPAGADGIALAPLARSGQVWVPEGPAVLLPDRHMRAVARTTEGQDLYMLMAPEGGGGGAVAPNAAGRYFLRVDDDAYQAVVLRNLKADWRAKP